ncbi:hypothetical protein CXU03_08685 [Akkermansia muciniphila]|uniref:hypothetical protein n=1 Tax=Akkermansia muciniphila TaxID=239935 RepID=UPI000C9CF1B3|nr:hypothetical protein [Akkermansia muciniphila]PNC87325.1 hypothetical protein CXU03_08685 [Akkermansia muciniphila]
MQKYKFTGITKEVYGRTLNQIACVTAFASIKSGEIGGYIEKEANLSQDGDAWVYENAEVYGNAWVYENAKVCGDAKVYENAWVCGNAKVYENAEVYGNAKVCGNAKVYGNAKVCGEAILRRGFTEKVTDYIVIGPQGTRSSFATFHLHSNTVCTGCFVGNLNEFKKAVYKTHNPDQGRVTFNNQYQRVIRVFEFLQEQDKDAQ